MRAAPVAACVSLLFAAACGGSTSGPSGNQNTTGPVTATINGQAWASASSAAAIRSAAGLYSLTALNVTGDYSLIFTLYNIGATGTYPLGTGLQLYGGLVTVSKPGTTGWSTPLNGAAGQISITTLTATRIAGTFSFTASPLIGTGSSLTVTNGTFDVPVTGSVPFAALPDNVGGRFGGTINGSAFAVAQATALVTTSNPATLTIVASNGERNLTMSLANFTGAGSYTLSAATPVRSLQMSGAPGNLIATWNSQSSGGSGTVVITSITAARIIGSYSATLAPLAGGASGNLTVTGTFDIGRGP